MPNRRSIPRLMLLAALPTALVAATVTSAAAGSDRAPGAAFGAAALGYRDASGFPAGSAAAATLAQQGFSVRSAPTGQSALVDASLAGEGVLSAATSASVELSWKAYAKGVRYAITRDGSYVTTLAPGATGFRDTAVAPGSSHDYRIVPELVGRHDGARTWGMRVTVPVRRAGETELAALRREALSRATAAAAAASTTVTWTTFIPQKRIDAPPAGCDYGRGYQYGGDNRSGWDWRNSNYRTSLNAVITWSNKSVAGYKDVKASHAYVKSTGRLVATKTASNRDMVAKKLGSGSNYVDLRLVTHATNPFCRGLGGVKGAIDGAITMKVTNGGNWEIRSGNHRLMPNHYIYIYNGGRVTNLYTRSYANAACLIGSAACPVADLTGWYGRYR